MTTGTALTVCAELRDLAAWLDDVALALRKFSTASPQAMRDWMRAQAARTEGRAFLARQALGDLAAAPLTAPAPFDPTAGTPTVYVILHAPTGTHFEAGATASRPAWTRDVPRFQLFETEAEAERVRAGLAEKTRRGALVVAVEKRPVPLVATADHIPGSCEFCPAGGGGCPVCQPDQDAQDRRAAAEERNRRPQPSSY